MTESDVTYFNRRATEEHESASKASHPTARDAHLALASRYWDLAKSITANARRSAFDDVRAFEKMESHQDVTREAPARVDAQTGFSDKSNRSIMISLHRKVLDSPDPNDADLRTAGNHFR